MTKRTVGVPYDWNVICQVCREKIKASTSVRRWDGLIVGRDHKGCFEHRHPLDMPAAPLRDQRPLPFTSPEPPDTSVFNGTTSSVTVTASPFTYTAGSTKERITITGGTIQTILVDGQVLPIQAGTFMVHEGASIQINYTVAPIMTKEV